MLSILNEPDDSNRAHFIDSTFKRILARQQENVNRVVHYYQRSDFAVGSDHLFVRLLDSLPGMDDVTNLMAYRDKVEDATDALTRTFDFSSPVNIGQSQLPGVLLGYDTEEIIVVTTESFDLAALKKDWFDASPIRFLRHPKSDLNLNPLNGTGYGGETGACVVLLNLPLLACQYRLWQEWEYRNNREAPRSSKQFLTKFPLANALYSFHEVAYLNIVKHRYRNVLPSDERDSHPFYLNTYRDDLIEGVDSLLDQYRKQDFGFVAFMNTMNGIFNKSLLQTVQLPSLALTQQMIWALVIARIPVISWMIDWDTTGDGSFDRQELNSIRRMTRRLKSERPLDVLTSYDLAQETSNKLTLEINDKL